MKGVLETSWTRHKFAGGSRRLRNFMDPHINLKDGQRDPETSWARKSICKETPTPHGPVYKFDGGSKRPRNLMDPQKYIFEGGSRRPRNVMGPYIHLAGDAETSWTRIYKFAGGSRRLRNLMNPYIHLQEGPGDPETSWIRI